MCGRRQSEARQFLEQAQQAQQADQAPAADRRGTPALARQVVLAALDPDRGRLWHQCDFAVVAALLGELAHEGRLRISGEGRKARIGLRDASPVGDAMLDDALLTIGSGAFGSTVSSLVGFLPDASQVLDHLAGTGVVTVEQHRTLGIIPGRRHHPTPAAGRDDVVATVRSVLLGESVPDDRTALLVAAVGVGIPSRLFVPRDRRDEADQRGEEVRDRLPADQRTLVLAVRDALADKLSREN